MRAVFLLTLLASAFSFAGVSHYEYTCTTGEGQVVVLKYKYDTGYKIESLTLNGSDASRMIKGTLGFNRSYGPQLTLVNFPQATYETDISFGQSLFRVGLGSSATKKDYSVNCVYKDLNSAKGNDLKF